MFQGIEYMNGRRDLRGRDNNRLIICKKDTQLVLLPSSRAVSHMLHILPLGGAVVTLIAPDDETLINDGESDHSEVEIAGQNIRTCFSSDKWYITGQTISTVKPKRKPRREVALT